MVNKLDQCWFSKHVPTVFHSGDMGDIIYSLLWCKVQLKRIHLVLGPEPRFTLRHQMDFGEYLFLEKLFQVQDWIVSVSYSASPPKNLDYNLNEFRHTWFGGRKSRCLFQCYAEHFKTPDLPEDMPWLSVDPLPIPDAPVIAARSPRFQSYGFPWKIVSNKHKNELGFIGLPEEFKSWSMLFGRAKYLPVKNAHHMARMIAGCQLFIGNQSFPMSLAMALGVPVVQEVFPGSQDCVFRRPQCVYYLGGLYHEPNMKTRYVSKNPNAHGKIELGPQENAFGLGDTLAVTPLAKRLGNKAIMCIPPEIAHFAPLFDGVCLVKVTDDYPVFRDVGDRFIESKLRQFGYDDFTNATEFPYIKLTQKEIEDGQQWLSNLNLNKIPLIVQTQCAKRWETVRSRPLEFWQPIIDFLDRDFSIIQLGTKLSLRTVASYMKAVGLYFGVNTGDWHLAMAAGCRCLVVDAEPCEGYDPNLWRYITPQVLYSGFNQNNIVERIPWLIDPNNYDPTRNH